MIHDQDAQKRLGVAYGVAAFVWWGFAVIYFRTVKHINPLEVLAHRIVWSVAMLVVLTTITRQWGTIASLLRSRKTLLLLSASTVLIAANWLTFIYAIGKGHILQTSVGYYINPLVNVLLGFLILKERPSPRQWLAIGLAAFGVTYFTIAKGIFPWLSILLAVTFGFYGLIRKMAKAGSMEGLTLETMLLAPLAIGFMIWLTMQGQSHFMVGVPRDNALLLLAGVVTMVPLLWYAAAARRLRYSTIGVLQYFAPTISMTVAITIYREEFTPAHAVLFVFIWCGVIVYSWEALAAHRRDRLSRSEVAVEVPSAQSPVPSAKSSA